MRDFLHLPADYRRALRARLTDWLLGQDLLGGPNPEIDSDILECGERERLTLADRLYDRDDDYAERVMTEGGFTGINLKMAAALWRYLADKTCRCY